MEGFRYLVLEIIFRLVRVISGAGDCDFPALMSLNLLGVEVRADRTSLLLRTLHAFWLLDTGIYTSHGNSLRTRSVLVG